MNSYELGAILDLYEPKLQSENFNCTSGTKFRWNLFSSFVNETCIQMDPF
jgi:hypothetical protein